MRILVLTKRQYMGKDLLDDRFGRFREIPLELANLGHEVSGVCLSYRPRAEGFQRDPTPTGAATVSWHSVNVGRVILPGLFQYWRNVEGLVRQLGPDLIWACSDAPHVIFGVRLARRLATNCVADLYDNFESFPLTRLPGVLPSFKRAVRQAEGVTCVSEPLAQWVSQHYHRTRPILVLPNGVRPDLFYPQDQRVCRRLLGLPEDAHIIGTAGAMHRNRGIDTLFRGFTLLAAEEKNLHLALAGPRNRSSHIPKGPRIHDFGMVPLEKVPLLINALDVAVICNRDSLFGRYSFPQKAYEILACRTPLIAAAVGPMKEMLHRHPQCLFEPDNPHSLAQAARFMLQNRTVPNCQVPSWSDLAKRLEAFLKQTVTP